MSPPSVGRPSRSSSMVPRSRRRTTGAPTTRMATPRTAPNPIPNHDERRAVRRHHRATGRQTTPRRLSRPRATDARDRGGSRSNLASRIAPRASQDNGLPSQDLPGTHSPRVRILAAMTTPTALGTPAASRSGAASDPPGRRTPRPSTHSCSRCPQRPSSDRRYVRNAANRPASGWTQAHSHADERSWQCASDPLAIDAITRWHALGDMVSQDPQGLRSARCHGRRTSPDRCGGTTLDPRLRAVRLAPR